MDKDKNCLSYWFPILKSSGVAVPRTEIFFEKAYLWPMVDGQTNSDIDDFISNMKKLAHNFGIPLFLRTGHTSNKHAWERSCKVNNPQRIGSHIYELVEFSAIATPSGLPMNVWVMRDFLQLDCRFKAFYGKLPIAIERRIFIKNGEVICSHPYWPAAAISRTEIKPRDYMRQLAEMNAISSAADDELRELSAAVAYFFEGSWSLDWARKMDGSWVAIDMALAEDSYHWKGCPHADLFKKKTKAE